MNIETMRKVLVRSACVIIALMMVCTFSITEVYAVSPDDYEVDKAYEEREMDGTQLIGEETPVSADYQALIDYYCLKDGVKYKGSGQCYGYAEMLRKRFGTGGKTVNVNKRYCGYNIYKYLRNVRPGTHVRFDYGYGAHSICIYKVTKNKMYYSDGNGDGGQNGIAYYVQEYNKNDKGSEYSSKFKWYIEPTGSYKSKTTVPLADCADTENKITVVWQPLSGAKSYTVYRSYSKSGKYTKVGTVKSPRFIDKKAKYGIVFYKIKAGKYTSKPCKVYHRLPSKDVKITHNAKGYPVISWPKVSGASKYAVYRRIYKSTGGIKLVRLVKTSGTSYTYTKIKSDYDTLLVRAIHPKNSKLNSYGTMVFYPKKTAPKAKIESWEYDDSYNELHFNVRGLYSAKHGDYLKFDLLRSDSENGEFTNINYRYAFGGYSETNKSDYNVTDTVDIRDYTLTDEDKGKTYYYKAVATTDYGEGLDSKVMAVTVPGGEESEGL